MTQSIFLYFLAGFYVLAGMNHFINRDFYRGMMPPYLPAHDFLIHLSGAAEIGLGILLLVPKTRELAAWGVIALLISIFPANVQMLLNGLSSTEKGVPLWALWVRLPIQGLLIYWAYCYTKKLNP